MSYYNHYSDRMKKMMVMRTPDNLTYLYNGINEGLINDGLRNRFYDNILKECKGKRCIDVGSGSGLLAFLALKNGAKHVTCIEQNIESCRHIKAVAEKMGIPDDKIRVVNDEFKSSQLHRYNVYNPQIIFHEIIGGYIWDDTIKTAFDVHLPDIKILPERYELRFSIIALTQKGFKQVIDHHCGYNTGDTIKIDPGVDLAPEYVEYYSKLINENPQYDPIKPVIINTIPKQLLDCFYPNATVYKKHIIDINTPEFYNKRAFSFELPSLDKPYLLFIHPFLYAGEHVLDTTSTSFNGINQPILVPRKNVLFEHKKFYFDLQTGYIKFDNEYI